MKNLLVGVAVLALAGTAFGSIDLAVLGPASVLNPGDTIQITISLVAKDTPITSWDGYVSAAGLAVKAPGTFADQYTVGAAQGWDTSGGIGVPVSGTGSDWVAGNSKAHLGTGSVGSDVTLGAMVTLAFSGPEGTYTIGMENVSFGIDADGTPYDGLVNVTPLRVQVLPEPVSALLLLAGLPMLRRRR
jgi:hypothetical protein